MIMKKQILEDYSSPVFTVVMTACEKGFCNSEVNAEHNAFVSEEKSYNFNWE